MSNQQLNLGDKIVKHGRYQLTEFLIERVTDKRAYANGVTFNRELTPKQATAQDVLTTVGHDGYPYKLYVEDIHAPILKKQKLEDRATPLLRNLDIRELDTDTLEKLVDLLTPKA